MDRSELTGGVILGVCIVIWLMAIGGWIANIVKLVGMDALNGMTILRGIGILLAPLGAVLGYL